MSLRILYGVFYVEKPVNGNGATRTRRPLVSSPTGCLQSTVWRATGESDRLLYLEGDAVSQTPLLG